MLRNDIHELIWFFDLEWVPDAEGAKKLYGLSADTDELSAMEAIWRETAGYSPETPRPFIKPLVSRVVSIAFLSRSVAYIENERRVEFRLHSLPKLPLSGDAHDRSEAIIVEQFLRYIGHRRPQLVGYNSAESDVQVLIQRALVNEIAAKEFCVRPENRWDKTNDYFARWDNEFHLDLLKLFSYQTKPRLNDLARLCGFPGKIDSNGDQVADMWLAGELEKIVEYNLIDTLNTYLIWLRVVFFCGKITDEEYQSEVMDFREFLEGETENAGRGFLRKFLDKWDA